MDFNVGDVLTVDGEKYIILELLDYENRNYSFVNKVMVEEDFSEEFYIFELLGNSIKIVNDDKLKNILLPKFEEMLNNDIKKITFE